ncbi:hypothetical protein IEO21_02208 [Rhodonia placenta]|uniref:Uncharacterized protein n=1 Tax=Rhodonia placenta TaxID=104341 RepID=A0A8H7P839_9APHY|nr:hypothetical protein IEO21_02208 [Postia placenta]
MSQITKFLHNKSLVTSQLNDATIADWLKPSRGEAMARLRTNGLSLLTAVVLTHLLPVPSPWTAISVLRERIPASGVYYLLCSVEVLLLAVLSINILQATYALKYPHATVVPPPRPSPAKTVGASSPQRQWRLKGLSPDSTPQRQKSFSYAASPVSTPSRTLNYTIPPSAPSPFDSSFSSSVGSVPGSPSSPLAAYRGRHSTVAGRAFDGSLLSRLARAASSSEDEDE